MLGPELELLLASALSIAALHTLVGVDHVIPFVALGRARGWTLKKTLVVTALCGVGHVLSSVLLGLVGVALGAGAEELAALEGARGEIAAWMLVGLGLAWMAWGLSRRRRTLPEHRPAPHLGAWTLFLVFVFGPCEPLIPLMMAPAMRHDAGAVLLVVGAFGAVTIGLMLALVAVGHAGLRLSALAVAERHSHVLVGGVLAATGLAMRFLGA